MPQTQPQNRLNIVYASSPAGHRQHYVDLFHSIYGFTPVIEQMSYRTISNLIASPKVIFATLDDNVPFFILVSILRGVLRRPTSALFLRPQQCFKKGSLKFKIKWIIFHLINKLPKLRLLTIVPFELEPRYRQIAHEGILDPQFWDMYEENSLRELPKTTLSQEILAAAAGRRVLCYAGCINLIKGFGFLADILRSDPSVNSTVLIVAAGKLLPSSEESGREFVAAGGFMVDRLIDDDELKSLYSVADMIWSCYTPEYDQASGIYGRAIQYGVPVLVRKGSLIDRFSENLDIPTIPLEWGELTKAVDILKQTPPPRLTGKAFDQHVERIGAWRENFISVVKRSLATDKA